MHFIKEPEDAITCVVVQRVESFVNHHQTRLVQQDTREDHILLFLIGQSGVVTLFARCDPALVGHVCNRKYRDRNKNLTRVKPQSPRHGSVLSPK